MRMTCSCTITQDEPRLDCSFCVPRAVHKPDRSMFSVSTARRNEDGMLLHNHTKASANNRIDREATRHATEHGNILRLAAYVHRLILGRQGP
eukprot:1138463-Pelagomonas_calceolata.AAC.1